MWLVLSVADVFMEEGGRKGVEARKEIDGERKVEHVEKFCYLESMIGFGGGVEEASRARVW